MCVCVCCCCHAQYMVDRIHQNYALQIIANSFLANPTSSATFATILVEYLLKHLKEMGSKSPRLLLLLLQVRHAVTSHVCCCSVTTRDDACVTAAAVVCLQTTRSGRVCT